MAIKRVLKKERWFLGPRELTGDLMEGSWDPMLPDVGYAVYGSGIRDAESGLEDLTIEYTAVGNDLPTEDQVLESLKGSEVIAAVFFGADSATSPAVGDIARAARGLDVRYEQRSPVGEMKSAVARLRGVGVPSVRGLVGEAGDAAAPRTTAGVGGAVNLGAVLSGETLVAALFVFAFDGSSLSSKIESDADDGFAAPTDRIAFTDVSAAGAQWGEVAGPITDTHFRINFTAFTGTNYAAALVLAKR